MSAVRRDLQPKHAPRNPSIDMIRSLSSSVRWTSRSSVLSTALTRRIHASSTLLTQFKLSDIGEGIVEVEIVKWFVKRGDRVRQFDPLCEVSSDKATVEITSRFDGVVKDLGFPVGAKAKVGQTLVEFESSSSPVANETSHSTPDTSEITKKTSINKNDTVLVTTTTAITPPPSRHAATTTTTTPHDDLATPAVRHLAKENGIDLKQIQGSGKDGRITKGDVLNYIETTRARGKSVAPIVPAATTEEVIATPTPPAPVVNRTVPPASSTPAAVALPTRVVQISGIRKEMVKSMTQSLHIPHLGLMEEVAVDEAVRFMQKSAGSRSVLPLCVKAASLALLRHPELNATTNEACTELYVHGRHNMGIAMDTPKGLVVPIVYDVQNKSVMDIIEELKRLRELGKEARFSMRDLGMVKPGGNKTDASTNDFATFVLSNVGSIGTGTYTSPVITPPMVGIGGFGRMRAVPRFLDDSPTSTSMEMKRVNVMHVSWAADHRVIDGATVARFAKRFKDLLENPLEFILEMR